MTRKKVSRRTITSGISFQPELWNKIQFKKNRSEWINEACKEKIWKETTKEGKIQMKKQKARELAKELALLQQEVMDLEE